MKQGVLIRLASFLLVGVVALLPAFTADAQGDASKHPPDLANVAQGAGLFNARVLCRPVAGRS